MAQVRRWEEQTDALEALDAKLVILTPDSPRKAELARKKHGLSAELTPVDPEVWASWGIDNPSRGKLPHPTTFVLNASGEVVFVETHVDYKQRSEPARVLESLRE